MRGVQVSEDILRALRVESDKYNRRSESARMESALREIEEIADHHGAALVCVDPMVKTMNNIACIARGALPGRTT